MALLYYKAGAFVFRLHSGGQLLTAVTALITMNLSLL